MQKFIALFTSFGKVILDILIAFIVIPSAFVLFFYRRIGSQRLKISTRILKTIGIFPIRDHYYEPFFNDSKLTKPINAKRKLPGIYLNVEGQLAALESMKFSNELIDLKLDQATSENLEFSMSNSVFGPGDADFLYQFIRINKPGKIIEIGSGFSTRIASLARLKNLEEGVQATHICIEPYEASWLESFQGIKLHRKPVEECDINWATELDSGDFLFIDSSHMIRPQGDVLEEYLNIIPQLKPGVFVHVHDIFTPNDYPERWLCDHVFFWNEQYLLESILGNSDRYEITAALNFLYHNYNEQLRNVCPYLSDDVEPGSFYFRIKAQK